MAVTESSPTGGQWAVRVMQVLRQAKTAADDASRDGATGLDPEWLTRMSRAYTAAATIGYNVTSGRTNEVEAKHHALARRLLQRRDDILRFAYDLRVPFDNNGSERDLRMVKLRQKISGTMRIPQGAQDFATIRSYLQTGLKQDQNALHILTTLFEGRPWLPAAT